MGGKSSVALLICFYTGIALAQVKDVLYSIDCREGLTLNSPPLPGEPDFSKHGGVMRPPNAKRVRCGFRFQSIGPLRAYIDGLDWVPVLTPEYAYKPHDEKVTPDAVYLPVCAPDTECQGCFTNAPKKGSSTCYFKLWMKDDPTSIIHADICTYNEQVPCKNTCENGQVSLLFFSLALPSAKDLTRRRVPVCAEHLVVRSCQQTPQHQRGVRAMQTRNLPHLRG